MFLKTKQWYNIKYFINNKEISCNDLEFHIFKNNSSLNAPSNQISSLSNELFIFYGKSKYIIKWGFWDRWLEFNSLQTEQKELPISTSIYTAYGKPINVMEMPDNETFLICGSNTGLTSIFLYSDEITSISINNN